MNRVEAYWDLEPDTTSGNARQEALAKRYQQRCAIEEQYGRLHALRQRIGW